MMNRKIVPFVASGFALVAVQGAVAQNSPAQPADSDSGASKRTVSTQFLLQNNGGSLFQASPPESAQSKSQPGAADAQAASVASLSLIGVPPTAPHVLKKHDLVNIVVQEASKSESNGISDQERQVDFDAKVDAFVKLNLAKLSIQGGAEGANPPEVKLEGQRDFKGTGDYNRTDTVSIRLEAEVIDVKPNGTLVVQARRHIKTDDEDVAVSLTGTCRVQDVDATNSVLSTDLMDLDFQKITKGQVRDTTKRGRTAQIIGLCQSILTMKIGKRKLLVVSW